MRKLSSPISDLQPEYGVIVVGSGYGGAIAACRMAERAKPSGFAWPAFSVALFERGIERQAGEYPTTLIGALRRTQTHTAAGRIGSPTALFDFRINHDVSVFMGCGLGGTSQINAGVMLPPTQEILQDGGWPKTFLITNAATSKKTNIIEQHFAEVERMLDVSTFPADIVPEKVRWLSKAVADPKLVNAAPVTISFKTRVNEFDVQQKRCVLCGNCMTGCNHSAKNTVAVNYLPAAVNAGAAVFCEIETRAIEEGPDGHWLVHIRLNDKTLRPFGSPDLIVRARMVFLAAGTLGSTEILWRSKHQYRLGVSNALGERFTGNGDVIAFAYNTPDRADGFGYGDFIPRNSNVGPTIAAYIDERKKPGLDSMMIQEGAIPGALRFPLRFGAPIMARATHILGDVTLDLSFRHVWREIDSLIRGARHGALARTQTFLAMGEHDGTGQMFLDRDRLKIEWPRAGFNEVYTHIAARLQTMTRLMRGRYVINPFWSKLFGRRLITAHPLGGCCIGDDPAQAVVNDTGQVFSGNGAKVHDGLYVCDGSTVPVLLGTNPALTISAVAEQIASRATKRPLIKALLPPAVAARHINPDVVGIKYAERLRGYLCLDPKKDSELFEIILHMSAENIDALINDREHVLRLVGVAHSPGQHWTISNGTLNVLIDDPRTVDTKLLVYRFKMTDSAGRRLWFRGHKVVNMNTLRLEPWLALTQVPFVIYKVHPDESGKLKARKEKNKQKRKKIVDLTSDGEITDKPRALDVLEAVEAWNRVREPATFLTDERCRIRKIVGAGLIRSTVADVARLSWSMRFTHENNVLRRLRWRWRYNRFFFSTVIPLRAWAIRHTPRVNPFDPHERLQIKASTLDKPVQDKPDRPRFTVTRYLGIGHGSRSLGPVMLAPGFGMSTLAFYAQGTESFAEYLHKLGYDVWLFDYRASDKLDASLDQFDVDMLAKEDFPDAIQKVFDEANKWKASKHKQKVRIVAHCLSSATMLMGLLAGTINTKYVHSMVLSQFLAFLDLPWPTRLKVRLHLPEILTYFNFRMVVTSDFDARSSWGTRVLDRLLYFFPTKEHCYEGVCRRLLLLYGEVARHANLDQRTHEIFYHLFDRGNLSAFRHIGRMFINGQISDKNGDNTYLSSDNAKRIDIPITLLQGTANNMFRPEGARKTLKWLLENGPHSDNAKYFDLVQTPGYGHLDSFIGRNAPRDVFPEIHKALQRMDTLV